MKNALKTLAKLAVSVAIIFLILRKIDERLLLDVLRRARVGWLAWSVAWLAFSKIISAFRFSNLLAAEGIRLSHRQNLRLYWLGMYYNLLLPGSISGDGYKIKLLMDTFGTPFRRLFAVNLLDRISGVVALGQLALLLASALPALRPWWWLWGLGLVLSLPVSWWVTRYLAAKQPPASALVLAPPAANPAVAPLQYSLPALHLRISWQSLGVQLAQTIATFGILLALGVGSADWVGYSLLFLVSSVVAVLPLTIGGAGARELTFLWGATWLGVNAEKAVAVAFVFYLLSTAVALVGIVFSFQRNTVTSPR